MKQKADIQELVIDGKTYIPKDSQPTPAAKRDGMDYALVRTYSAGVHCGYLAGRRGKEVTLVDSIRIWKWAGAATLSQLAMEGTNKPNECKFGVPITTQIVLTEAIEIINMTQAAQHSVQSVASWKV